MSKCRKPLTNLQVLLDAELADLLDAISEIVAKTVIYKRRMVTLGIRDKSSFVRLRDELEGEVGDPRGGIEMP